MTKSATVLKSIEGIDIRIPVGSMDPPDEHSTRLFNDHCDPKNWKYAVRPAVFKDKGEAENYVYCLNWHVGGHESIETWTTDGTEYIVSSRGYYHYVGV